MGNPNRRPAKLFLAALAAMLAIPSALAFEGNVVLVTLDGVRAQELFGGVQKPSRAARPRGETLFPKLWNAIDEGKAFAFGSHEHNGAFHVANNSAVSLPGYRTILSGVRESDCRANDCPNIDRETIFDRLAAQGFRATDLGAFASWIMIGRALESTPGKIDRNVAFEPFPAIDLDPASRAVVARAIELSRADAPEWSGSRKDLYTWEIARTYLSARHPRFLYVSFVDSDEYGHQNRYREYTRSLLTYDGWISDLRALLAASGEYGDRTSIIVTTDHGRSIGPLWKTHGRWYPGSFRAWAAVIPAPALLREAALEASPDRHDQLDIRPTIEWLLGTVPLTPGAAGQPLIRIRTAKSR
jgi:hypothetical protein